MHLAGESHEAPFPHIADHNIIGTFNALEAARQQQVRRVVLASSHHTVGMTPLETDLRLAPDSFYAVSKATVELLGELYARKTPIEVVTLRIGSFREIPSEPRHHFTWLSPRDAVEFVKAALKSPLPDRYAMAYALSQTRLGDRANATWELLGYCPQDDAFDYPIAGVEDDRYLGGSFVDVQLPVGQLSGPSSKLNEAQ